MGKKKATGTVEKKRSKYADDVTGYNLDLSMQSLADVSVPDLVLLGRVTSFDFSLNSLTSLPVSIHPPHTTARVRCVHSFWVCCYALHGKYRATLRTHSYPALFSA